MIGRVYRLGGQFWRVAARAEPFDTRRGGPARNVLLERVEAAGTGTHGPSWQLVDGVPWRLTGEFVVRPFRGLRLLDGS